MGILTAPVAKELGAKQVVISDPSPCHLALAKGFGITSITKEEKFDLTFEISGSPEGLTDSLNKV